MTNHSQPDGTPPGWQEAFLAHLRETGNVSAAARAAGTCRSRCYEWRRRDRVFAAAWADALEEAADRLEMEAFRRAVKGVGEDRFFQGSVVGEVTHYSDSLLMFLLRARRPSRFGARPMPFRPMSQAAPYCPMSRRAASRATDTVHYPETKLPPKT